MIEIDDAVKYFNDCKPKYLSRFSEKTPEGNYIEGWICHKPNRYLGSLLIDVVNGEPHHQFIQSMPKINYIENHQGICIDSQMTVAFEKLDGSCLIIYPLLWDDGTIMEIVPKTRGRAVADKNFLNLYNKCDHGAIYHYYFRKDGKGVLFFEMYGILNQHEIIHYDTGVDLVLIGAYDDDHFFNCMELWLIANINLFKQPDEIFRFYENRIRITSLKYRWILDKIPLEALSYDNVGDAIISMQNILDWLNSTYNNTYGKIATEGVVLNTINTDRVQKYVKVKPTLIENKHRSNGGIPKSEIRKEVYKYFDEYGSKIDEIYNKDKKHHTKYLHRMLSEDYNDELIQKSSKNIEKVFMQIWDSKQIPQSIHNMGQELFDKYGDEGITHCMRMFSQVYPMKKNYAKTVYQVLEKIYARNGLDLNGR